MDRTSAATYVVLIGFPPIVFGLFTLLGPKRGMLASLVGGWLFLPAYSSWLDVPLLRSKGMFVPGVVLIISLVLDSGRWRRLRFRLLDLPITGLVAVAFLTSISNDLGAYDGLSAATEMGFVWGAPYLLGRLYLGEPRGLRDLAKALILGAIIYVPLCLWEVRMSPQLHRMAYGFVPSGIFLHNVRFGGYRPTVFMTTGLMVGTFMATGTMVAFWLWRTRALRFLLGVPMAGISAILLVTTVLVKSVAALILMLVGYLALEVARRLRTPALALALLAIPPAFCAARLAGWDGEAVVRLSGEAIDADRAQSVEFRIRNENLLLEKAQERPWLGWGRWGRARVFDDSGRDVTITDSLWVITLGTFGFLGLLAQWLSLAMPTVAFLWLFPARLWGDPRLAMAALLAVALMVWIVDNLLNAMVTPIFPVIAGALVSFDAVTRTARARRPRFVPLEVVGRKAGSPVASRHGA
jgi:hypothetical protein